MGEEKRHTRVAITGKDVTSLRRLIQLFAIGSTVDPG